MKNYTFRRILKNGRIVNTKIKAESRTEAFDDFRKKFGVDCLPVAPLLTLINSR